MVKVAHGPTECSNRRLVITDTKSAVEMTFTAGFSSATVGSSQRSDTAKLVLGFRFTRISLSFVLQQFACKNGGKQFTMLYVAQLEAKVPFVEIL